MNMNQTVLLKNGAVQRFHGGVCKVRRNKFRLYRYGAILLGVLVWAQTGLELIIHPGYWVEGKGLAWLRCEFAVCS